MSGETLGKAGINIKSTTQVEVPWEKLNYSNQVLESVGKDGATVREHLNTLTTKLVHAGTEEEKTKILVNEFAQGDGHIGTLLEVRQVADIIQSEMGKGGHTSLPSTGTIQGGIRPSTQGLRTLSAQEIVQQASQRDPTQPYFDTNSDHMVQIDPLAPRTVFSGEGVKTINPLKPGPTISNLG